jgi:hypothetical protein
VAFWESGVLGVQAKSDIGPNKVFVFVPYALCLNQYKARTSEISHIFTSEFFKAQPRSKDYVIYLYVMHEKIKGEKSFWHPYFSTLSGITNLVDWTEEELDELQDELIIHDAAKWKERVERIWARISIICSNFPDYFPPTIDLKQIFLWSWRVCCTRTFGWDGGMMVPMAGSTNHAEVYTTYDSKSKEDLLTLSVDESSDFDYSDFLDLKKPSNVEIDRRQNRNRLEKFLDKYEFPEIRKIWGMDRRLDEFRSSSSDDDERTVAEVTSEEDECDNELDEVKPDGNMYFVMSTGVRTCFLKGEQVFNAYGRLNNRNLLLDYGFATPVNRYDTVYFLLWVENSGRQGVVGIEDVRGKTQEYFDSTELYGLKFKRLNIDVLTYFRGFQNTDIKDSPSDLDIELEVIDKFLSVCLEMLEKFPTTLEQDQEILSRKPCENLTYALWYRMGQKRILLNQIKMLENLRKELEKIKGGLDLMNHLVGRSLEEVQKLYPLRIYLKSLNGNLMKKKLINK